MAESGRPLRRKKEGRMGNPVVHFEIIGKDPTVLREYYADLFEWEFDTGGPVSQAVSEQGDYGFTDTGAGDGLGIPGGIGGGSNFERHTVFYVGVPDAAASLEKAERLGGRRVMGPDRVAETGLVVGQFLDPEGNLVGVAQLP
jgi:predicted enzyme related to lactoylglutathione lyase